MLGHPALVASHRRGDPEREALLPQQGVAAVAGAVGPDLARLGEVSDVLLVAAGPGHVLHAFGERHSHRVQAGHVLPVSTQYFERAGSHPRHDPHRHGHVGRVRELDADVGDRGPERAHRERHHVHGAAAHRAAEEVGERIAHLRWVAPVVGRSGVVLPLGADEGPVLDASHIAGVGAREVRVRPLRIRKPVEGPSLHQLAAELRRTPRPNRHTNARPRAGSAPPPARPRRAASGVLLERWWRVSRACGSPCVRIQARW